MQQFFRPSLPTDNWQLVEITLPESNKPNVTITRNVWHKTNVSRHNIMSRLTTRNKPIPRLNIQLSNRYYASGLDIPLHLVKYVQSRQYVITHLLPDGYFYSTSVKLVTTFLLIMSKFVGQRISVVLPALYLLQYIDWNHPIFNLQSSLNYTTWIKTLLAISHPDTLFLDSYQSIN